MNARQLIEAEDPKAALRQAPHPDTIGDMSECDNCDWHGIPTIVWPDIPGLGERCAPGGVVPSGECPSCGALCYSTENPPRR